MRVYFNDLTLTGDAGKDFAALKSLLVTFKKLKDTTGEKHLWAPRGVKATFRQYDWSKKDRTLFQLLLAVFHEGRFAIDSEDAPEEMQDHYVNSTFEIDRGNGLEKCEMMGWAEINHSLTLGLPTDAFWDRSRHVIVEETPPDKKTSWPVLCLTKGDHFKDERYQHWVDETYRSEPELTSLLPAQKKISLRDDHGLDLLLAKAKQLVKSGYVVEVVNSLAFNPSGRRFCEESFEDGLINLRLYWTDKGLGLVVKTTGKNLVQTEKIGRLLEERYGYR